MKTVRYILFVLSFVVLHSCLIENDMSYPKVSAEFTAFGVRGQESVTIDAGNRTVSVVLSETADITALEITELEFTDQVRCTPFLSKGDVINLSEPMKVTLSIYQDYEWTISATQPIERYVRCTGQIGDAVIDVQNHDAVVYVSATQSLSKIIVEDMKLGPETSVIIGYVENAGEENGELVEFDFPLELDCTLRRYFYVEYEGEITKWSLNVFREDVEMSVTSVIPWCYSADIEGEFDGGKTPVLEYRPDSEEIWSQIADISVNGTAVSAKLTGLTEGTLYHVRFSRDGETGKEVTFTTGSPDQIENMDFDDWYMKDSKVWYPTLEANYENKIWDSANEGVAEFLSVNPTTPSENVATTGSSHSAKLTNMYALIKFAAGNILTGDYIGLVGISGARLSWGTPFTGRPVGLKGYYSYSPGYLDYIDNNKVSSTELDKCQILVMLTDWDEPFEINTTLPNNGGFVDQENDPHIIAYGKIESDINTFDQHGADAHGFIPFTLKLDYRRPDGVPKYAVVIACASYKGDLFTGSTNSVMYVDEFEFVYE